MGVWRALAMVVLLAAWTENGRPPGGAPGVATDAAAPVKPPRYLALGDSFTIGTGSPITRAFPARLGDRWTAQGCVVELQNVAANGFTTDDVIAEELPVLPVFRPTFVTVAIGANDIVQGHGLDAYRANVRRILEAALATGARVVVLPQPDWSRSPTAASFGTPAALNETISRFNAALAEETRAQGAQWVDLVPLMRTQAVSGMVAGDELHPSADAYDAWAAELARVLPTPCAPGAQPRAP